MHDINLKKDKIESVKIKGIKTLGVSDTGFKAKNWFYNICPTYKVKNIELIDSSDDTYKFNLFVDHCFRFGDNATIIDGTGVEKVTNIAYKAHKLLKCRGVTRSDFRF